MISSGIFRDIYPLISGRYTHRKMNSYCRKYIASNLRETSDRRTGRADIGRQSCISDELIGSSIIAYSPGILPAPLDME